jgi:hypothetical protein
MHSYNPSSFARSLGLWCHSLWGVAGLVLSQGSIEAILGEEVRHVSGRLASLQLARFTTLADWIPAPLASAGSTMLSPRLSKREAMRPDAHVADFDHGSTSPRTTILQSPSRSNCRQMSRRHGPGQCADGLREYPQVVVCRITPRPSGWRQASSDWQHRQLTGAPATAVCIENLIRFDCVVESHNVSANGRADILLAEHGCLALQVEEPA